MRPASVETTSALDPAAMPRRYPSGHWATIVALLSFAGLCAAVLLATPALVEPDDFAYKGSILGITHGYLLELTTAQMRSIAHLDMTFGIGRHAVTSGPRRPVGIVQWVHLANGRWISEKNPGYPFLAAPFQWLGLIRLAPLFYGALGCMALFVAACRWLGPAGGAAAVGLYCSSGAALLFAWRDYMPTFTDTSLIAAGAGLLLWTLLANDASARRRTAAGLAAFLALEAAVSVRYTNIIELACAVLVTLVLWLLDRPRLPTRMLVGWLSSVAVFAVGLTVFNDLVYGGPLRSGYRPGEIVFRISAIAANLRSMPLRLIQTMPMTLLALAALFLARLRWGTSKREGSAELRGTSRRDLAVACALGSSWLATWGLYSAYAWTAEPGLTNLQAVRFYLPALGLISLLGALPLARVASLIGGPNQVRDVAFTSFVLAGLFSLGVWSYNNMRSHGMPSFPNRPPAGGHRRVVPAAMLRQLPAGDHRQLSDRDRVI
jgi:hypothetical protein